MVEKGVAFRIRGGKVETFERVRSYLVKCKFDLELIERIQKYCSSCFEMYFLRYWLRKDFLLLEHSCRELTTLVQILRLFKGWFTGTSNPSKCF